MDPATNPFKANIKLSGQKVLPDQYDTQYKLTMDRKEIPIPEKHEIPGLYNASTIKLGDDFSNKMVSEHQDK